MTKVISSDLKIYANIRQHVYGKKRCNCAINGCGEDAIVSHLLQRNGLLSQIAENGHLCMFKIKDIYSWTEKECPFEFKIVGIRYALSVLLFCNKHDAELFADIEKHTIDVYNYHHQLLLSLRSLYAEKRLKEYAYDLDNRVSKATSLSSDVNSIFAEMANNTLSGIKMLDEQISILESELVHSTDNIKFEVVELPQIKVAASSSISMPTYEQAADSQCVLPGLLLHIIPNHNNTILLIGYFANNTNKRIIDYVNSWRNLDNRQMIGTKLTNLFAGYCEMWVMSPSLYYSLSKSNVNRFYEMVAANMQLLTPVDCDFNLFGDGLFV